MAAHGLRDMGEGSEKVANPEEIEALRRKARQMNRLTLVATELATALIVIATR